MNRPLFRFAVAVAAAANLAFISGAAAQNAAQSPTVPTPRMPNGKPDLSGMWGNRGGGGGGGRNNEFDIVASVASRRCAPGQKKNAVDADGRPSCANQTLDQEFVREDVVDGRVIFSGRWDPNRPLYRPEYWDRVQYLDENTNSEDPIFRCQPQGITRVGPPTKIVQAANEVILFYPQGGASTSPKDFRIVPTDGRKHAPSHFEDVTFWGHAVGHWEGDTLVVDSVGFNDLTWLARGGFFHSENLRVIERFRREGNVLDYAVTVEDPEVLLEPWVLAPRQLYLNTNPNATIPEGEPCRDTGTNDPANYVTKIRH